MPYIDRDSRGRYDILIDTLALQLKGNPVGHLNYVISRLIWKLFLEKRSYSRGNEIVGVLSCVSMEFYRRQLAPYEDKMIEKNGDVEA